MPGGLAEDRDGLRLEFDVGADRVSRSGDETDGNTRGEAGQGTKVLLAGYGYKVITQKYIGPPVTTIGCLLVIE